MDPTGNVMMSHQPAASQIYLHADVIKLGQNEVYFALALGLYIVQKYICRIHSYIFVSFRVARSLDRLGGSGATPT